MKGQYLQKLLVNTWLAYYQIIEVSLSLVVTHNEFVAGYLCNRSDPISGFNRNVFWSRLSKQNINEWRGYSAQSCTHTISNPSSAQFYVKYNNYLSSLDPTVFISGKITFFGLDIRFRMPNALQLCSRIIYPSFSKFGANLNQKKK